MKHQIFLNNSVKCIKTDDSGFKNISSGHTGFLSLWHVLLNTESPYETHTLYSICENFDICFEEAAKKTFLNFNFEIDLFHRPNRCYIDFKMT
jgi:hypothetical protein